MRDTVASSILSVFVLGTVYYLPPEKNIIVMVRNESSRPKIRRMLNSSLKTNIATKVAVNKMPILLTGMAIELGRKPLFNKAIKKYMEK